jgi:hypothetical protein
MRVALLPYVRAADHPLGHAVADDTTDMNNSQFLDAVKRTAEVLAQRGVAAGDVVAIMLPNIAELIVSLSATWRLGAAVTPINSIFFAAGGELPDSRRRRQGIDSRRGPSLRAGSAGRQSGQRRLAGTAHLHQRDHRPAQRGDARSCQPRRHVPQHRRGIWIDPR